MITQRVENRLACIALLPDLRADLLTVIRQSEQTEQDRVLHQLPLELFHALGGEDERMVEPFIAAWACLHTVLLRLDHLQDNDPEDEPLPTAPNLPASYNLLLAAYVLANSALDDLDASITPPERLLRLHRLWNECILTGASGQHCDLIHSGTSKDDGHVLDQYQQVAHAKSGALFALGFAGVAPLTTDDSTLITACHYVGDVYGTLLQLSDDLIDYENRSSLLTLDQTYNRFSRATSSQQEADSISVWEYLRYVRAAYLEQVERVLVQIDHPELCSYLRRLFSSTPTGAL